MRNRQKTIGEDPGFPQRWTSRISKALLYTEDGIEYTRTEVSHRSVIWDRGATMPRKNALEEDIFRNSRIPRITNENKARFN